MATYVNMGAKRIKNGKITLNIRGDCIMVYADYADYAVIAYYVMQTIQSKQIMQTEKPLNDNT